MIGDLTIENAMQNPLGTMLPERVIQEVLRNGFAALTADSTLLDELFHKLDKSTLNDIKAYFAANAVTVRLNFPRDDIRFPLVAILSASDVEDPSGDMLGDYMTSALDAAETTRYDVVGHFLRSDFNLFCLAGKDSNAALWLYYVAKAVLMLNLDTLISHGLQNIVLSGRDISLREDLFPEVTFSRVLSLACTSYFSVRKSERVAKALVVTTFTQQDESGTKVSLEDA